MTVSWCRCPPAEEKEDPSASVFAVAAAAGVAGAPTVCVRRDLKQIAKRPFTKLNKNQ